MKRTTDARTFTSAVLFLLGWRNSSMTMRQHTTLTHEVKHALKQSNPDPWDVVKRIIEGGSK